MESREEILAQDQVDKRYRILMIAPTPFFADSGSHVRILEEALILRRLGSRITICTYHNGRNVNRLAIERTMGIPWWKDCEAISSWYKLAFDALLSFKSLAVALRKRPDVIHAHLHEGALIGYVLSKIQGLPLVFDFQGSLTSEMIDHNFLHRENFFYGPLRWMEEVIDSLPKAVITSSQHAAELLREEFHCPPEKIHIVPDCVNPDFFAPEAIDEGARLHLKAQLGIPSERKVVIYLGLLAEYQGIGLLMQAARRLVEIRSDLHFLIMGYPAVDHYQKLAATLGIAEHATFTGRVPYSEAPLHLSLGDIAVAPKVSATEGNGKLLNYMAMELPIVAFDTPVNREYLGDLGVYASFGDPESLALKIAYLLEDGAKAIQLGRKLREQAVASYSTEIMGRKILKIYEDATGG